MNYDADRRHKEACLKYTLIAAEESDHDLRDLFLKQASRLEQEIRALTPYETVLATKAKVSRKKRSKTRRTAKK